MASMRNKQDLTWNFAVRAGALMNASPLLLGCWRGRRRVSAAGELGPEEIAERPSQAPTEAAANARLSSP